MSGVGTVGQVHDEIEKELVSRGIVEGANEPINHWRKNATANERYARMRRMLATIYDELRQKATAGMSELNVNRVRG